MPFKKHVIRLRNLTSVDIIFSSSQTIIVFLCNCKAAFTLIYILIVNILPANKIIYKWLHLYIKTQIHK